MRNISGSDSSHVSLQSSFDRSSPNPDILPKKAGNSFYIRNRRQALEGNYYSFKDFFVITPSIITHKRNASKADETKMRQS